MTDLYIIAGANGSGKTTFAYKVITAAKEKGNVYLEVLEAGL